MDFLAAGLRPTEGRRLLIGLALSLSCHLLFFGLAEHRRIAHAPRAALPLIVALQPGKARVPASETGRQVAGSAPVVPAPPRRTTPVSARAPSATTPEETHQAGAGSTASHLPDAAGLLDAARRQLDSESRRRMLDPMFSPPEVSARVRRTDAFERALGTGTQRVEQLADGSVRVTSANGRQYCLQPMPEVVARGLPQPPISTPTNCP